MEYLIRTTDGELYHHGVKGMKWGVRKAQKLSTSDIRKRYESSKADYKEAKKTYNKSFNKAYNKAAAAYSPIKKHRQANDARWNQAAKDADKLYEAKKSYKQAKNDRKQQIDDVHREINKKTTKSERFWYNDATRANAAKYVVDNNMSVKEATQRAKSEAKRNTAAILAVYGAVTVGTLYAQSRR